MRLLILIILAISFAAPLSFQKPKPTVDTAALLSKLQSVVGMHLTITKHELVKTSVSMGSETYWLVFIKPQHPGHFDLKYRYKYNEPLYSHVEKNFPLRVGKKGCLRGPQGNGYYGKYCLGDTIILPIQIGRFTEHTFSLTVSEMSDDEERPAARSTIEASNEAEKHLRLVESRSYRSLHCAGGYTLERYAKFEAREPGRFNLSILDRDSITLLSLQTAGALRS